MNTSQTLPAPHRRRLFAAAVLIGLTALAGAATRRPPRATAPASTTGSAQFSAPAGGPVSFSGHLDRSAVQVGGDGVVRLELLLGAEKVPTNTATPRVATDLIVVLDRSGSMDGDKIVHARGAVRELLQQLHENDRFALVTYSSGAELTLPLAPMTLAARARWLNTVDGIVPAGGTNMAAGLDLALSTLTQPHERRGATRVILISDGLANEGDATPEGLVARAQQAARREVSLTTVGVGEDFNEYLMTALADAGTGNYYYVQRASDLGNVFAREFGAAATTVASNVAVEITPASGVRVVDAAGYPLETDGGRTLFRPGTLFSGQERRIWVTFDVPRTTPAEQALGTVALTYAAGTGTHRVAFTDTPRIACVATERDFLARIDMPAWERAVSVDSFNKMQDEVARQVKDGKRDGARAAVDKFRRETAAMNQHIKSPAVEQKLQALGELEGRVDDAFQGANQKGKQNTLSKTHSAAAYDSRRAGAKY